LSDGLGVQASTTVWLAGTAPLPPRPKSPPGPGRPRTRVQRAPGPKPVSLATLAARLAKRAWRTVSGREGSQATLASRFAALRVRPAHRDETRPEPWPTEWLLVEWPKGEAKPTKYWVSNLPATTPLKQLVQAAKARWVIERDYQELKPEIGLGHYEGRGWRGFHHHASRCSAAYGFLIAERCLFPPQHRFRQGIKAPALPHGFQPRGTPHPA
jgi:SRSO17 transposase